MANGKLQLAMPMDKVKEISKLSLMVSMVFLVPALQNLPPASQLIKEKKVNCINEFVCALLGLDFAENSRELAEKRTRRGEEEKEGKKGKRSS